MAGYVETTLRATARGHQIDRSIISLPTRRSLRGGKKFKKKNELGKEPQTDLFPVYCFDRRPEKGVQIHHTRADQFSFNMYLRYP